MRQACRSIVLWSVAGLMVVWTASRSGAIEVGLVSDFQDGTTQGWTSGDANPNPPVREPDGGPGGVGDAFVKVTGSGQSGAGGKPVTFNRDQWTGDYAEAGVLAITADVRNLAGSAETLEVRLALLGFGGPFASQQSFVLEPGSDWTPVRFDLEAERFSGFGNFNSTLTNLTELRFFHGTSASSPGPDAELMFGLDNVTAVGAIEAVPGDADGDGDVDAFDLGLWQTQFGATGDGLSADFDVDGDVDAFDLGIWQIHFGTGLNGAAVPEPATLVVLVSAMALARRANTRDGVAPRRGL